MNHIIHNISIVFMFFGIILLTYNLTKTYNQCPVVMSKQTTQQVSSLESERPSRIFNKMFKLPDVWMGYADFNTKSYSKLL
jgi:hypothetical protein